MTDPIRNLRLEDQLCFAVYSAAHAFTRFYKPLLDELGITYPQYLVLLVLWESDALPVSRIGARLGLDSGTLTPLLKRMEAAGLVQRQRSPRDERQVLVTLTERGRAQRPVAEGFPQRILNASQCSAEEIGALQHALVSLRQSLDAAA